MIADCPKPVAYRSVLLPKDQELELYTEEDTTTSRELETPTAAQRAEADIAAAQKPEPGSGNSQDATTPQKAGSQDPGVVAAANTSVDAVNADSQIDNPYLRSIQMPRVKGGGSKKYKWA